MTAGGSVSDSLTLKFWVVRWFWVVRLFWGNIHVTFHVTCWLWRDDKYAAPYNTRSRIRSKPSSPELWFRVRILRRQGDLDHIDNRLAIAELWDTCLRTDPPVSSLLPREILVGRSFPRHLGTYHQRHLSCSSLSIAVREPTVATFVTLWPNNGRWRTNNGLLNMN